MTERSAVKLELHSQLGVVTAVVDDVAMGKREWGSVFGIDGLSVEDAASSIAAVQMTEAPETVEDFIKSNLKS